ncbi:MAG: hypothetical protein C0611_12265 [Desulfobacteraceae bacterium]|jgi:hypothetical protein|nr:MAG: hypothetical protein C0611_12265 [Desulfobacteraceae bacterium]
MAKLFSARHKDTKALRTNEKIKSFVSLCLCGKHFWFPDKSGFPPQGVGGQVRFAKTGLSGLGP